MKKRDNKERVIQLFNEIDKQVRAIKSVANKYDAKIDEAFLQEKDQKAKEYMGQKISLLRVAETLEEVKSNMQLSATLSQAFSGVAPLTGAIAGCKGFLKDVPNFKKLGDELSKVLTELNTSSSELGEFNKALNDAFSVTNSYGSVLDSDIENSKEFKNEMAAAAQRIRSKSQINPVSGANNTDGLDSISDIINKINDEDKK